MAKFWKCDRCKKEFNEEPENFVMHVTKYDLCKNCYTLVSRWVNNRGEFSVPSH